MFLRVIYLFPQIRSSSNRDVRTEMKQTDLDFQIQL